MCVVKEGDERNWCHSLSSILHELSSVTLSWSDGMEEAMESRCDRKDQPWGMIRIA